MGQWRTTVSGTITVPRKCDRCGHSYGFTCSQMAEGTTRWESSHDIAQRRFRAGAEWMATDAECVATYGVLCPACGEFSRAAVTRHAPNGFRAYVVNACKRHLEASRTGGAAFRFMSISIGVVGLALLLYSWLGRNFMIPRFFFVTAGLMFGALAGGFGIAVLVHRRETSTLLGLQTGLPGLSEELAREFVVQQYHKQVRFAGDPALFPPSIRAEDWLFWQRDLAKCIKAGKADLLAQP